MLHLKEREKRSCPLKLILQQQREGGGGGGGLQASLGPTVLLAQIRAVSVRKEGMEPAWCRAGSCQWCLWCCSAWELLPCSSR